ncbi:MAG TPA: FAD-binding oxidoreductase [Solirubrobacteraceae bacterium]|nr:FAD-binding oxidoreductase [Solirubrobacteraceae bacterium]
MEVLRPAAIARCATAQDVTEALALARREALPLAVRSGGHCFAGRSSTTGVLIDVGGLDHVALGDGVVTVGAGARLAAIYDALAPHDRTIAGGCGATVGIAGLALGGGLGVLGRRHGLTCDQVIGAEVVLADGTVVDADGDLLWALRGAGGGQFGIVTRLALKTVPAPPTTCFHVTHPLAEAPALIDWWQRVAPDAPEETAASLVVRPDGVHLFGVGDIDGATTPAMPYREAKRWLNENGPPEQDATDERSKSEFFRDLIPGETIATLTRHFAHGSGARELDFSPWGGAYNRTPPDATAFPHRDARFLLKLTGPPDWVERAYAITHPHGTGGAYVNFPDPYLDDPLTAYHGVNLERLREVKVTYDPGNVFRFPQSL